MSRAATTTDAFNAIAEPRRRDIIESLASGPRNVGQLLDALGQSQPLVSKHLRGLREVGVVTAHGSGTVLSLLVRTDGRELRDMIVDSGMEVGMQGQMDRIEEIAAAVSLS